MCVGGGVALNCLTNSSLLKIEDVKGVYVPPAPQDQGLCIGNALYGVIENKRKNSQPIKSDFHIPLYLGKQHKINEEIIKKNLIDFPKLTYMLLDDVVQQTARMLSDGDVISWYQGRSEFGPRALGNRSILADPRDKLVLNRLNLEIKNREAFRPFAPSVLKERVLDYFLDFYENSPSMMFTAEVNPEKQDELNAITHVDGTARLQTVDEEDNPLYYKLIKAFGDITGVYTLVNTSFNLDGMPIVETPRDAISCFARGGIDGLILGNYLIKNK